MKKFWSFVLICTLVLCIFGCKNEVEICTVRFVDVQGNLIEKVEVEKGTPVEKPTEKVIAGYDTTAWLYQDKKWDFDDEVTKDMKLQQVGTPHEYSIDYELDGGEITLIINSFNRESDVSLSPATKKGYIFAGWYLEKSFKTLVHTTSELPYKNVTLHAKFEEPKQYTIIYLPGGGTFIDSQFTQFSELDERDLPRLEKPGCEFIGWLHNGKLVENTRDLPNDNVSLVASFTECSHVYENRMCIYCGHEYDGLFPPFPEGMSCAEMPELERCGYIDGWAWNYNRLGFDGKGMEIVLLCNASEEVDPYNYSFTGERKVDKQKQLIEIEQAYNIDLVIKNYPKSVAWGPNRVQWLNDNAASGTLVQQGHILQISSDWVPTLKQGNSIAELYNTVKKTGIFTDLNYEQSKEKNQQYSIGTKVYGYSTTDMHADNFLYYNRQLVIEFGLEDPATLWNQGRWDWSYFYSYITAAQAAFDAKSEEKIYAFGGFVNDIAVNMLAARGYKLIDNESGTVLFTNPNTIQLYNDLREINAAGMWAIDSYAPDVSQSFVKGLQLFAHGQLWFLSSEMRFKDQTGFDIGVVPYPTAKGAAKANGEVVPGYLVPMRADYGYAFPKVSNGQNGLTTIVLVNIMDDFSRGLAPEFDIIEMTKRDLYIANLYKMISGENDLLDETITAIMSIEDNIKYYGYTNYMDIISKIVGGGSDWNLEGFATWGMSLVTKQDVNPSATLQSKKDIYQKAFDEILCA